MARPPVRSAYRFPDDSDAIEFRAFTHGLQPARVPSMMRQFTEDWRRFGVDAWNRVPNHWRPDSDDEVGWWTLPTYLGDEFIAPLLGANVGTCILQTSVHWTVQCLLSSPEVVRNGSKVVVSKTAFPSLLHSVKRWSDLVDLDPHVVAPGANGRLDHSAILDAIGPDTALVALSHVGFTTGERLTDSYLQEVAHAVHQQDALVVLDGYHAAGTMPIDVSALDCDVYVGGLLKEASGSAGNAFVYLRPGLELTPRTTGWFGDSAPFEFRQHPEPHSDVRRRFLGGTTPVAPFYHAVEGLRILLDIGMDAVREHSLTLTGRAIQHADQLDLRIRSPRRPENRSALVLLEIPEAKQLTDYLKQRGVYTDSRQNEIVRMAPFVWNTREEVDRAFEQIETALSSETYLTIPTGPSGPVT